jgi:hypothetical protein
MYVQISERGGERDAVRREPIEKVQARCKPRTGTEPSGLIIEQDLPYAKK